MPRIRQKADEYAMKDFVAEINAQCGRYGYRTQRALGDALGVCQKTAGNYLQAPGTIKMDALRNMVKVLHLNPVIVLKALGYTSADIKKIREE